MVGGDGESTMRPGTALLVMLPLVAVAAAFVLVTTRGARAADPREDGVYWDEDIASFVRRKVANTYVDPLTDAQAEEAFNRAMDAYLDFDAYCDYIPPSEYKRWKEDTAGQYAGLGVQVRPAAEGIEVVGMLPGGPADKAGLSIGDTITAADGRPLAGLDVWKDEHSRILKGAPGSTVRLTVLRGPRPAEGPPPGPPREVLVRRELVKPPSVFARRVGASGDFGVVRLTEFAEATSDDFDRALDELVKAPKPVKGLVLDLRDNGGGVLLAAVHVADRFLAKGLIVHMEGRAPQANRDHTARGDDDIPDTIPLVVLVNSGSASASEVVAGALQDHRRALIVGERTYGKFLVQQITDVPGKGSAVQLVTARYYTPSGRSYQRQRAAAAAPPDPRTTGYEPRPSGVDSHGDPAGLLPDVVLPLADADRKVLLNAWKNEEDRVWGHAAPSHPDVPADHVDPQLRRALDLLDGELVLRRIGPGR
jgi:carboxyl-terminal processing protease